MKLAIATSSDRERVQRLFQRYSVLKYFDDMKIEDISYVLDVPINTVKSHLKRAKESLSDILKEGI